MPAGCVGGCCRGCGNGTHHPGLFVRSGLSNRPDRRARFHRQNHVTELRLKTLLSIFLDVLIFLGALVLYGIMLIYTLFFPLPPGEPRADGQGGCLSPSYIEIHRSTSKDC